MGHSVAVQKANYQNLSEARDLVKMAGRLVEFEDPEFSNRDFDLSDPEPEPQAKPQKKGVLPSWSSLLQRNPV